MARYSKKRPLKRRGRRRPYKKRRVTVKGVSRKVNKLYSAIEVKHFDQTYVDFRPTITGFLQSLTSMPVGDTDLMRNGDKVTSTSLQLRWQIGGVSVHNLIRFIVLKVRGNLSTVAGGTSAVTMRDRIFQNAAASGLGRPWLWKYNVDYFRSSGARILYDSFHDLYPTSQGTEPVTRNVYGKKKFHHRQNLQYTAGNLSANHEIVLLCWGEALLSADAPYFSFSSRLNYIDL